MDGVKGVARRVFDVMSTGNLELADQVIAPDCVDHEQFPGLPSGLEGFKQFVQIMRTGFPDLRVTVQDMIAAENKVAARVNLSGRHTGSFMGIGATGKTIDIPAIDILRIENGKVVEHWGVTDQLRLLQQIGVVDDPQS